MTSLSFGCYSSTRIEIMSESRRLRRLYWSSGLSIAADLDETAIAASEAGTSMTDLTLQCSDARRADAFRCTLEDHGQKAIEVSREHADIRLHDFQRRVEKLVEVSPVAMA
jgi:hypothetical protein